MLLVTTAGKALAFIATLSLAQGAPVADPGVSTVSTDAATPPVLQRAARSAASYQTFQGYCAYKGRDVGWNQGEARYNPGRNGCKAGCDANDKCVAYQTQPGYCGHFTGVVPDGGWKPGRNNRCHVKQLEVVCCKAMTAECLACAKGISAEEYCKYEPTTQGCKPPPSANRPAFCRQRQHDGSAVFRFCKMNLIGTSLGPQHFVYPLGQDDKVTLSEQTNAVSPRRSRDIGCIGDGNYIQGRLNAKGRFQHYPPTFPDSKSASDQAHFWAEFATVARLQKVRVDKPTTPAGTYLRHGLPAIMNGWDMAKGAAEVRADFPSHFPTLLAKYYLGLGGVKADQTVIPGTGDFDFVNFQVMLANVIGWSVSAVSPTAFAQKWEHGRPRPEEIAQGVKYGFDFFGYNIEVPSNEQQLVDDQLSFATKEAFTAYTEGSPKHPSYPAMHSAASTASLYLAVVLDLTDDQHMEAIKLDCAVASFRTYAGVHYESDNQAGLAMGQVVIEDKLPAMLAAAYGSDKTAVENKIKQVLTKWDWRQGLMLFGPHKGKSTRCLDGI